MRAYSSMFGCETLVQLVLYGELHVNTKVLGAMDCEIGKMIAFVSDAAVAKNSSNNLLPLSLKDKDHAIFFSSDGPMGALPNARRLSSSASPSEIRFPSSS